MMETFYIFYVAIGFGVAIGMVRDGAVKKHGLFGVFFGAALTGSIWPIFIAVKLTQKLVA